MRGLCFLILVVATGCATPKKYQESDASQRSPAQEQVMHSTTQEAEMDQYSAIEYCSTKGGLPSIEELRSLHRQQKLSRNHTYWSSMEVVNSPNQAFALDGYDGKSYVVDRSNKNGAVRCVNEQ